MITITDEQIREIFNSHKVNLSTPDINPAIYDAARDLIALAQEVRPLAFAEKGTSIFYSVKYTRYSAVTNYGIYSIYVSNNDTGAIFPGDEYFTRRFTTEAEAIAAAQADFNRRVLENLTHGVADEN